MNPLLLGGVWLIVTLDCAFMGYRLAMGRSALLHKRRHHQVATVRGALFGQVPLAAVTLVAAVLVDRGGALVTAELNEAMRRFVVVGGVCAGVTLFAATLCALPSVSVRTGASVVIFGPLTLLRPLVVIGTVVVAIGLNPAPELVAIGLLAVVPGVAVEPLLDRRIARQLLT